ncbi:primosomal protein N' [Wolbachia pipientis]|uniref:Replication restart protein PriA n=1 Tax=Wolbachia pipientis TaxID=955 RepID=A0A1E7QL47_WOLPI|nr:primosomal protein N' [Wolbachia pipientis]OEY87137.1 primosomal protein N' [Wolbachia pipientis]
MTRVVNVLLSLPINRLFSYVVEEDVKIAIGDYVIVPFGNKRFTGIVWQYGDNTKRILKSIERKIDLHGVRVKLKVFAEWVSQYNLMPLGILAKMIMGGVIKLNNIDKLINVPQEQKEISQINYQLNSEQQNASDEIIKHLNTYSVILLDGETGSGKTEVYLSVIAKLYATDKLGEAQVLILLPEIILTSQLVKRMRLNMPENIAEWHSALTPKARRSSWLNIVNGNAKIIIGARSALFLPYKNLRLIIVDEEHDASFKQGAAYNARDMAIILAKIEVIPIILSSATPLLETIYNVKSGNYIHVRLKKRFSGTDLPQIKVVNMKNSKQWISDELFEYVKMTIEKKQQVMLFLNRRGYAQLAMCKKCGSKISCLNCNIWLTYHKKKNRLLCHHCFYQIKFPEICTNCQNNEPLFLYGIGIERLLEEMVQLIPNARTAIISSDQKSVDNVLDLVLKEEINIIIGTQIIAKGHNFPKLTLVGIINADLSLENSDLRAAEKTYQLLHQVSGRSGRFSERGTVIIQTRDPSSKIIDALQHQQRDLFYDIELESRRKANMPPFSRLIALIISGKSHIITHKASHEIVKNIPCHDKLEVFGPSPAALNFLDGKYRYRILLKIYDKNSLFVQKNLALWIKNIPKNINLVTDVDPINFF